MESWLYRGRVETLNTNYLCGHTNTSESKKATKNEESHQQHRGVIC